MVLVVAHVEAQPGFVDWIVDASMEIDQWWPYVVTNETLFCCLEDVMNRGSSGSHSDLLSDL